MTATLTAQQAAEKLIADFHAAIHPAVLANTHENGLVLALEIKKRGVPQTVENLVKVVNDILFQDKLVWIIEPAKLQAQKANTGVKPEKAVPQVKYELDRQAAARAEEAATALKKDSDKGYAAARSAVAAYQPLRHGRMGSSIEYNEQSETQKLLTAHIAAEEARGVHGQKVLEKVGDYLADRYAKAEGRRERI